MHLRCRAIVLSIVILVSGAAYTHQKQLAAADGWIKMPADGETATAAFATVDNPTMYDVYLVSASTDVAAEVQFRESGPGGKSPTAKADVTVPAFGKVEMKPDGLHLWLVGLKRALAPGEPVTLWLTTDGSVTLQVTATVK